MTQTVAALIAAAVDYERTLVLAIEVSNESWVLAAQVPGATYESEAYDQSRRRVIDGGDCWISRPRYRFRPQRGAGDYGVRGGMVGLLAGAVDYEAWDGGIRYPAFECACRSSDAPRKV